MYGIAVRTHIKHESESEVTWQRSADIPAKNQEP